MRTATTTVACLTFLMLLPIASLAQLSPYSESFESLGLTDFGALSTTGWRQNNAVYEFDGTFVYETSIFPASNVAGSFGSLVTGEGGATQGTQQLLIVSNYNNTYHMIDNVIETRVFRSQIIGADDVGNVWVFAFQAKRGDLAGQSTAFAFIKTLPAIGSTPTNFMTAEMTGIPTTWTDHSLAVLIDASLEGQILQFGFLNRAQHYEPSGVFYDNIRWNLEDAVPTRTTTWGQLRSMF